ncbi:hypothetical protein PCAU_4237 [Pseudomonas chlororaphis subsp. aurantiaca]|nr:hypothetical protein PCAU_4237 [Pseudomonas chlororaphis subsp. aurantiaca]
MGGETFQVTGIAALQQALAVAHVSRMRHAVDPGLHECELLPKIMRGLLLAGQAPVQPGIPAQGRQQRHAKPQASEQEQPAMAVIERWGGSRFKTRRGVSALRGGCYSGLSLPGLDQAKKQHRQNGRGRQG